MLDFNILDTLSIFAHMVANLCYFSCIWDRAWQIQQNDLYAQWRLSAWASARIRSVLAVRMKKSWVLSYLLSAQQWLVGLGRYPGWSRVCWGHRLSCWFCRYLAQFSHPSLLYVNSIIYTIWKMCSQTLLNSLNIFVLFMPTIQGSHRPWRTWTIWREKTENIPMHGKIMEFEK